MCVSAKYDIHRMMSGMGCH